MKRQTPWTVEQFEAEMRRLDPNINGHALKAGVVMLAALQEGTNPDRLTAFTAYPKKTVREFVTRLQRNGIFLANGRIAASWFDDEDGGIAFWGDVCVALGFITKAS